MSKSLRWLILILLLVSSFSIPYMPVKGGKDVNLLKIFKEGWRREEERWIIIHVQGYPYERGFQYGYLASDEIIEIIYRWCDWLIENNNFIILRMKNKEKIWELYKSKAKEHFLENIPTEYIEEMQGITDGINSKGSKLFNRKVEFEDILTLQLVQDVYYSCFRYIFRKVSFVKRLSLNFMNLLSEILGKENNRHCIAFIATGDATRSREIIAVHSTIFSPLITEKCNIILDVQPMSGYRFAMTTYPGAIWSCEDYYQNEKGIVMVETELPQGPWIREGVPKGARSRNAIQYSDTIDDVISHLMKGNNDLIPNEWLIGDAKTGEIASLEQALFNTPIKRTYNGFYWSCNYPHHELVKRELYGSRYIIINILEKLNLDIGIFTKINKFKEIEKEYYGKIDIEDAKKIVSTDPLANGLADCKITSSSLLKEMKLITYFGNPKGDNLDSSSWISVTFTKSLYEEQALKKTEENSYQEEIENESLENASHCILIISIGFLISFIILNIYKRRYKNKN